MKCLGRVTFICRLLTQETSCAYADAKIWVYIINDLSCHGEHRLVLKAIPWHKSTFYNVRTQGILYVHFKLITEAIATFEISIPLAFYFET